MEYRIGFVVDQEIIEIRQKRISQKNLFYTYYSMKGIKNLSDPS